MAYVISDDCISCGTCEGECPVGAISMGADHYQIDPDACTRLWNLCRSLSGGSHQTSLRKNKKSDFFKSLF